MAIKRYEYPCDFLVYEVDRQRFSNMAFNKCEVEISYFPTSCVGCWAIKFSYRGNKKMLKRNVMDVKAFLHGLYTGMLGKSPLPNL